MYLEENHLSCITTHHKHYFTKWKWVHVSFSIKLHSFYHLLNCYWGAPFHLHFCTGNNFSVFYDERILSHFKCRMWIQHADIMSFMSFKWGIAKKKVFWCWNDRRSLSKRCNRKKSYFNTKSVSLNANSNGCVGMYGAHLHRILLWMILQLLKQ